MGRLTAIRDWIKKLLKQFFEQNFYQVKHGNTSEWITLDELIKRNKERHFYQNLLGEQSNEIIKRNLRYTNTKIHDRTEILSVSSIRTRK